MSGPEAWSPEAARQAARQATYPNSQTERETVAEIDRRAFARYNDWERGMHQEASERRDDQTSLIRVSGELYDALDRDVINPLDGGAAPDRRTALQFERLSVDVTNMIEMLETEAAQAELLADRLDDPAADFERVLTRLPVLRTPLY